MTQKTISIPPILGGTIEQILCLSTLIASEQISESSELEDADKFYYEEMKGDCDNCPCIKKCLACIIKTSN